MSAADLRIERDLVRALFGEGPAVTLIAAVMATLIVAAMWESVPRALLWTWFGLVLATQAVRIALWHSFHRANPQDARVSVWAARYTTAMVVGGALFGSTALIFLPYAGSPGWAFIMIVVAGLAAGSITTNAYYRPAMFLHLAAILLPMVLQLAFTAATNRTLEPALGIVSFMFYGVMLVAFGRNQSGMIRRSLEYAYRNEDLVGQLREKTEIAEAAQTRAEQASRAKSHFFAAASHDLRQPMQALGLYAASLREARRDPNDARKIDQILSSVDALESLFDELLDISKLDAGYVRPNPSHFPVDAVFRRLEAAYAPIARKVGLDLEFRGGEALVHSDAVLLERVLGNLLSNALRYTEHGRVALGCRCADGQVTIEVIDTGIGIPKAEQARIFEEFYQLGNPERDRRKGLGLGLATVKRITQLLGCPLELESDVGLGATFRVQVPAGDPARVTPPAAPESPVDVDALRGRIVVVIEDEVSVREGLVELLRDWHCEVIAAASAAEAIAALSRAPEVVLADYRLREGKTGIDAIAELRAHHGAALPAILVTGDTAPEIFAAARDLNVPLLPKPVRAVRLRAVLTHLLSRQREASAA